MIKTMNLRSYENPKWIMMAKAAVYMCADFPQKLDTSASS